MSMTRAAKMLMVRDRNNDGNRREGVDRGNQYRYDGGMNERYDGNRYEGGNMPQMGGYPPEDRFRDRRGREHYDNGRFAPRNEYGDMRRGESQSNGYPYFPPYYNDGRDRSRHERSYDHQDGTNIPGGDERMGNPIGFDVNSRGYPDEAREPRYRSEVNGNYGMMVTHRQDDEMEQRGGIKEHGHAMGGAAVFNQDVAEKWTRGMENDDGGKGPHWTLEQVKKIAQQKGSNIDPLKLWVAMNAEYSDRSQVNKKHGVTSPDFYYDSAVAFWIKDKDAVEDKLGAYYEYIVKK